MPALLWGLTNNIAFYQYYLDPAAVAVLQNMKIPVTAVLLHTILSKNYSANQWFAIIFLSVGCIQSQYPCGGAREMVAVDAVPEQQGVALAAVLAVVIINSFCAVYMEGLLKDADVPFWRTNQYLYSFGMGFQLCGIVFAPLWGAEGGLFGALDGFNSVAWFQVCVQSCIGLSVSQVMRVYDSNIKNGCVALGLILTYMLSVMMGYAEIRFMFMASSVVVVGAICLYTNNPYTAPESTDASKV